MSSRTYEGADSWRNHLIETDKCIPKPLLANAIAAFREHPDMQGVVAFDAFALQTVLVGVPPWARIGLSEWQERPWRPDDDTQATEWLQHRHILVNSATTAQAIETVANENPFHPVVEYLDGLEWDRESRIDDFMSVYLGAARTPYSAGVSRVALLSAVARIMQPGCKADHVPILEGGQGVGKSTAVRTMFHPWFTDELADLGSKDASMQTRGRWGIEVSELDAMSRGEVSRIKAFISRDTDRFRPPYGARIIESPRACVFWGTTNADNYLKDETGGRRFLPIKVGKIEIERLEHDRDQLWAEARYLQRIGTPWWLMSPEATAEAKCAQQSRYAGDPWQEAIAAYVRGEEEVTVNKILRESLMMDLSRCGQPEMTRVARILRSLDFMRVQRRSGDNRCWVYRRPVTSGDSHEPSGDNHEFVTTGTTSTVVPFNQVVTREVPAAQASAPLSPLSPLQYKEIQ